MTAAVSAAAAVVLRTCVTAAAEAEAQQQQREKQKALEDAKRHQQEKDDREAFERERTQRRQRQAREHEQRQRSKQRVEEAKTMPLEDVIDIVELNNSGAVFHPVRYERRSSFGAGDVFRRVIVALKDIVDNIMAAPDNPQFRHIREKNEKIQCVQ